MLLAEEVENYREAEGVVAEGRPFEGPERWVFQLLGQGGPA